MLHWRSSIINEFVYEGAHHLILIFQRVSEKKVAHQGGDWRGHHAHECGHHTPIPAGHVLGNARQPFGQILPFVVGTAIIHILHMVCELEPRIWSDIAN